MKTFQFWNSITGWFTFLIASIVYLMTMEPTTSLWDCGEFIATAYKLEVTHPPGAPLFMILARFFSIFASGPDTAAKMINALSALASGFTMRTAEAALRRAGAKELIVAVPTGHEDAVRSMAKQVDVVCCANIRRGRSFAVASAYRHWSDVSEAEAEQILLGTGDTQG